MAANVNNYIAAGNAAVKNTYASLAAARDNAPKYDEIAKQGMKSRTEEKVAAMKADAAVKATQVKADAYLEKNKIVADAKSSIAKSNKKTQFAGKIAAAGAVMASALMPAAEIIKPGKIDYSASQSRLDKSIADNQKKIDALMDPNWKPPGTQTFTPSPAPTAGATASPKPDSQSSSTLQSNGMYQVSLVDLGTRLRDNFGLKIGEHSAFGGTSDVHTANSYHDYDEALDIQDWRPDVINGVHWQDRTANLRDMLKGSANEVLGPGFKGHDTHVHIGARGGMVNFNQQQYDYLFGGNAGGKNATFTY